MMTAMNTYWLCIKYGYCKNQKILIASSSSVESFSAAIKSKTDTLGPVTLSIIRYVSKFIRGCTRWEWFWGSWKSLTSLSTDTTSTVTIQVNSYRIQRMHGSADAADQCRLFRALDINGSIHIFVIDSRSPGPICRAQSCLARPLSESDVLQVIYVAKGMLISTTGCLRRTVSLLLYRKWCNSRWFIPETKYATT